MDWLQVIERVAFPVAVAAYLLWQQKHDRERTNLRVERLETYITGTMESVIKANTAVMRRLERWLEKQGMSDPDMDRLE